MTRRPPMLNPTPHLDPGFFAWQSQPTRDGPPVVAPDDPEARYKCDTGALLYPTGAKSFRLPLGVQCLPPPLDPYLSICARRRYWQLRLTEIEGIVRTLRG